MKLFMALFISFTTFSAHLHATESDDDFADIPEFKVQPLTPAIVKKLREGGYVLYMRHGNTDTSRPDQPNMDLNDCATQRVLTEEGKRIVKKVGDSIRKAKIPVGELFSSPLCRTKETAVIAFGKNATVNLLLRYTANMNDKEKLQALDTIRELVSNPVPGKNNRVIVAHSQNMMALIGYLPSPEGTVVIFKPLGNKQFKYIASVKPEQWGDSLH
jgi:phosphohistidine phosphatase SixA